MKIPSVLFAGPVENRDVNRKLRAYRGGQHSLRAFAARPLDGRAGARCNMGAALAWWTEQRDGSEKDGHRRQPGTTAMPEFWPAVLMHNAAKS
jgi:hypothetical protein